MDPLAAADLNDSILDAADFDNTVFDVDVDEDDDEDGDEDDDGDDFLRGLDE